MFRKGKVATMGLLLNEDEDNKRIERISTMKNFRHPDYDWMHPRNPYRVLPNYKLLSVVNSQLKPFVLPDGNYSFKLEGARKALNDVFLKRDWNLKLSHCDECLIPLVASRLNYILYLEDVVRASGVNDDGINVVDIGCGASCIYGLLGCRKNANWSFVAVDCDKRSVSYAEENVKCNSLSGRIEVLLANKTAPILSTSFEHLSKLGKRPTIVMCNPPFFSSEEEKEEKRKLRSKGGKRESCVSTESESITAGGEVNFIQTMIKESQSYDANGALIYSSLIGCKSSLRPIIDYLGVRQISWWIWGFMQGKCLRWVIIWSFELELLYLPLPIRLPSMKSLLTPVYCSTFESDGVEFDAILRVIEENIYSKFLLSYISNVY